MNISNKVGVANCITIGLAAIKKLITSNVGFDLLTPHNNGDFFKNRLINQSYCI